MKEGEGPRLRLGAEEVVVQLKELEEGLEVAALRGARCRSS